MPPSPEDPSHRRLFDQLHTQHSRYSFDRKRYGDRLADITFLAVSGPTQAGKATLIREAIADDSDLHLYQSSSTQPPEDDTPQKHRYAPIEVFANAVANGSLVNYYPHPNGHIYGTFLNGFQAPITIGAVSTGSIEQLFDAGFHDVRTVYTLTDGPTYEARLGLSAIDETLPLQRAEALRKRLIESLNSLAFAHANSEEDWFTAVQLSNEPGALKQAARNVARIGHERSAQTLTTPYTRSLISEMSAVATKALHYLDTVY